MKHLSWVLALIVIGAGAYLKYQNRLASNLEAGDELPISTIWEWFKDGDAWCYQYDGQTCTLVEYASQIGKNTVLLQQIQLIEEKNIREKLIFLQKLFVEKNAACTVNTKEYLMSAQSFYTDNTEATVLESDHRYGPDVMMPYRENLVAVNGPSLGTKSCYKFFVSNTNADGAVDRILMKTYIEDIHQSDGDTEIVMLAPSSGTVYLRIE